MLTELMTLEMTFADGEGCLTVGHEHPLVSVFRRAVETGRPSGNWLFLVVRPSPAEKPKLLGTVAWTPGGRFLYFPGKHGEVASTHPNPSLNGGVLDHVTLELDETMSRYDEHVAVLKNVKGNSRGLRRKGVVHAGHLHPWFSLLLRNVEGYENLPKTFQFEFPVPSSDIQRRLWALIGVGKRSATTFPVPISKGPHYFQMDVWAGRGDGWKAKRSDAIPWPTVTGVLDGHEGEQVERIAQIHELDDGAGIVTVLTRPSGSLRISGLIHAKIEPISA